MQIAPKRIQAAIAGLLHDIGKLEQRARVDPWRPAPGAEQEGQPVHASWSIYFAQTYIPQPYRQAALAGAYHHHPDKSPAADRSLSELVALADKLSAGERADPVDQSKRPPRQMISIFDRVSLEGKPRHTDWHYLPLQPLSLDRKAIFPSGVLEKEDEGQAYLKLCEELRQIARQDIQNASVYLENLLAALQRLAWAVPSAYYYNAPDVSLYDHSRMTAALAVCLSERTPDEISRFHQAIQQDYRQPNQPTKNPLLDQEVALLIGGDLSGVQDFIYTISHRQAAKSLRGRSFYLQLLTEAVLRFTLSELGLPYTNVIYSGGGHFFILAPLSAAASLPDIQKQVSQVLLAHHGSQLYLAYGASRIPLSGFSAGNFPRYWSEMHHQLSLAKSRRYIELGEDLHAQLFEPLHLHDEGRTCAVCGADDRPTKEWDVEREDQARICDLCASFSDEIGAVLPRSSFVALGFSAPQPAEKSSALESLKALGMQVQFLESKDQEIKLNQADQIVIWALDDAPSNSWPASPQAAVHQVRYTLNRTPLVKDRQEAEEINQPSSKHATGDDLARAGEPKTFNHLLVQSQGFKRLGALRMDVDNLGMIFKHGLGNYATLARLSTLSFQLSLFFEGWIKHLCQQANNNPFIYAVYAGGDDLFLIGPWERMPHLAYTIRQDFAEYTGAHAELTLSGGMAFIPGKYPVYQAAEDAAIALDAAKQHPGKNAFNFLDHTWSWTMFPTILEQQQRLLRIVGGPTAEDEGMQGPSRLLQILQRLAGTQTRRFRKHQDRAEWGPWMWQGAYHLKRMQERYKNRQPELTAEIESIYNQLDKDNYRSISEWGFAARWAQLLIRKNQSQSE